MALSALLLSVPVGSVSAKAVDNVDVTGRKEKVIINFKDGINEKTKKQIMQEGNVKEQYQHINLVSMEIGSKKLAQLKTNPNIKSIEPDIKLSVDQQTVGYGQDNVNALESRASGLTGKGTKVAVIDSEVSNHSF